MVSQAGMVVSLAQIESLGVHAPEDNGMSWLLLGILVLFVIVSFRYSRNTRYFYAMIDDLTDVKVRHNAFDDTVRETSFLLLLNFVWCVCSGVLFYCYLRLYSPVSPDISPQVTTEAGSLVCGGMALVYTLLMTGLYFVVGNVFSDSGKTELWVKGYLASQGLDALILVPVALLALVLPESVPTVLIIGGIAFLATKMIFIFKGFRIFFNQTASWVLFLYYLCSLEIVPLILAYVATSGLLTILYE